MVMKKKVAPKKPQTRTKKVPIMDGKKVVKEVEMPISDIAEMQDGVMPTVPKQNAPQGYASVSLAIGCTLNMGDYQSARIDAFIQRNVPDTDEDIRDAYSKIGDMLHSELERQSAILMDDE